ncbi:MAG: YtxH domain-containing protein [Sandaracinaceae bacterium]
MSLTNTLIKAGAMYALGRLATNVKSEDVEKVVGLSGDDFKKYGLNRADALLGTMGLTRQANVPNTTGLVLSGFAAGALVGAGVTFLFYSEQGKDVRAKIAEFFAGGDAEETSENTEGAETNGASETVNGSAKANA